MAPSRHDWKIVDWDVKPQHNQPTFSCGSRLKSCETVPTVAAVHGFCLFHAQGTTRRKHANNDACEIDDFIGCEGDFPI